jgi:predicted short-subunit dehydrogenase-like oxidoreductase (DUF2520 family)
MPLVKAGADRGPVAVPSAFIIGAGRLGSALAIGLAQGGWEVAAHARSSRGREQLRRLRISAGPVSWAGRYDLVFLAVPDDAVAGAARDLAPRLRAGQVVAHGAGALSLTPLAPVCRRGAHRGSLHPIQALAGGPLTPGTVAALDGEPEALQLLSRAAEALRLSPIRVPERGRVLYHAAATIASNLCMALADLATETWTASGAPPERAADALVPLLRGAVENLAAKGLPGALTGPASRGDARVVAHQLGALRGDAAQVYRLLSRRLVELAARGGLDARKVSTMRRVLRRSPAARRRFAISPPP